MCLYVIYSHKKCRSWRSTQFQDLMRKKNGKKGGYHGTCKLPLLGFTVFAKNLLSLAVSSQFSLCTYHHRKYEERRFPQRESSLHFSPVRKWRKRRKESGYIGAAEEKHRKRNRITHRLKRFHELKITTGGRGRGGDRGKKKFYHLTLFKAECFCVCLYIYIYIYVCVCVCVCVCV